MLGLDGTLSLFVGAVALGVVHGAEPGHGWPIAAIYALDRQRTWFHGFAASFLLGVGHLVSSVAVVAVFFLAKDFLGLTELGWVRYVAGVLLIALGVREYRHGHSHGGGHAHSHGDDHDHSHEDGHDHSHEDGHSHGEDHEHDEDDHSHEDTHSHDHEDGHDRGGSHGHSHLSTEDVDERGLWGIVSAAFVLGFAHEEEFEIIGLCLGSNYCLELMLAYAIAVLVALVALTLLLVAGFERYGDRVEGLAEHFPTISAVVLVAIGLGFIFGVL